MRFCMISTFYPPYHFGGDATYVRALSRALVARGNQVEVVHCRDAFEAVQRSSQKREVKPEDGVLVHELRSRFGVLSPLLTQQTGRPMLKHRALKQILSRNFDVVHFHNISLIGGPAVLGLSTAPVTLYSLHEHWLLCPTHVFWKNKAQACDRPQCLRCSVRSGIPPQLWRYSNLVKRSIEHVDSMLAPSKYTAEKHREAGFGSKTHVLPLFSNLDPGRPDAFRPPPNPNYVYAGRVTASKGILPMLRVFAGLPDMKLRVVGDGDMLSDAQRDFAHCQNIEFTGPVPQHELTAIFRNATALILPSLAPESFGLTVIEAFACATPAIVRNAGGSRELVDATGAGFVYARDEELAQAVQRLGKDAALRTRLGKAAREGFERFYTADQHVDRYLDHIGQLQAKRSQNPG
jgi:glycosyltransferase involved in cell wall biosynthesis